MPDLTPKQAQFVKEYVVDFNATQAAIRAGYSKRSAKQIATENLSKPVLQQAIAIEARKRAEAVEVTAEAVIAELGKIAFANMQDFMRTGPDGLPVLDWRNLTRDQAAALNSVTVDVVGTEEYAELEEDADPDEPPAIGADTVRRVKFKLESKQAALEKLGRYFNLFKDRSIVDVNLQGGRTEHGLTDDELLAVLMKRGVIPGGG